MKTNRQRLWNIVIAMSVAINLVMLGGIGYIASVDSHINNIYSSMNSPVVIYIPKAMEVSSIKTPVKSPSLP